MVQTFIRPVQADLEKVEALMQAQSEGQHSDLRAAMALLISAGGKRIRPAVTLLVGKMLGAQPQRLVTLAAAIEMLHTATLVHDDLIDSSVLRRGVPTLNSQWSPGATVLTGDFVFARAAYLAAETESIELMKIFARTLSTIVNGEITQLFASRCSASRADYEARIYAKTASLFETSAATAALISPVDAGTIDELKRYGYAIGMAFQIVDDILDFTGEQDTVGKPVGSDLRQGIVTLPTINYLETYPNDPQAQKLLRGECLTDAEALTLVESIRSSNAIQMAHNEACQFVQSGLAGIRRFNPCIERQSLEDLAEYITSRNV